MKRNIFDGSFCKGIISNRSSWKSHFAKPLGIKRWLLGNCRVVKLSEFSDFCRKYVWCNAQNTPMHLFKIFKGSFEGCLGYAETKSLHVLWFPSPAIKMERQLMQVFQGFTHFTKERQQSTAVKAYCAFICRWHSCWMVWRTGDINKQGQWQCSGEAIKSRLRLRKFTKNHFFVWRGQLWRALRKTYKKMHICSVFQGGAQKVIEMKCQLVFISKVQTTSPNVCALGAGSA